MEEFPDFDRQHFDRVIDEHDLKIDDFEITLKRDSPEVKRTDSLPEAGTGTVTVVYMPTEISRAYRYDVIPHEHTFFERDLNMNQFRTRKLGG